MHFPMEEQTDLKHQLEESLAIVSEKQLDKFYKLDTETSKILRNNQVQKDLLK
jgi:hypothetical protein